jgi:hypothetical protein
LKVSNRFQVGGNAKFAERNNNAGMLIQAEKQNNPAGFRHWGCFGASDG